MTYAQSFRCCSRCVWRCHTHMCRRFHHTAVLLTSGFCARVQQANHNCIEHTCCRAVVNCAGPIVKKRPFEATVVPPSSQLDSPSDRECTVLWVLQTQLHAYSSRLKVHRGLGLAHTIRACQSKSFFNFAVSACIISVAALVLLLPQATGCCLGDPARGSASVLLPTHFVCVCDVNVSLQVLIQALSIQVRMQCHAWLVQSERWPAPLPCLTAMPLP